MPANVHWLDDDLWCDLLLDTMHLGFTTHKMNSLSWDITEQGEGNEAEAAVEAESIVSTEIALETIVPDEAVEAVPSEPTVPVQPVDLYKHKELLTADLLTVIRKQIVDNFDIEEAAAAVLDLLTKYFLIYWIYSY